MWLYDTKMGSARLQVVTSLFHCCTPPPSLPDSRDTRKEIWWLERALAFWFEEAKPAARVQGNCCMVHHGELPSISSLYPWHKNVCESGCCRQHTKKNSTQSMIVTTEEHYRESSMQSFDVSHTFLVCNPDSVSTWDCMHSCRSHFIHQFVFMNENKGATVNAKNCWSAHTCMAGDVNNTYKVCLSVHHITHIRL